MKIYLLGRQYLVIFGQDSARRRVLHAASFIDGQRGLTRKRDDRLLVLRRTGNEEKTYEWRYNKSAISLRNLSFNAMYKIAVNAYNEPEHWVALNEKNVYVSHTADYNPNYMNHMHASCELLLAESGAAEYRIGNVAYELEEGDLLIIGPMDPHSRVMTVFPFVRYGLTLLPRYLESLPIINEYASVYRSHTAENFQKMKNLDADTFGELKSLIVSLGREDALAQVGHSDMIYALLLQLTIAIARLLDSDKSNMVRDAAYQGMLKIRDYIDTHFAEDLSLDSLSRRFFLGPTTISRQFVYCFGTSISNYISSVRITNVARLLEGSALSVTEVAERVGFGSVNTFIRQFGKKIGVSPLRYRKQHVEYARSRRKTLRMPG